MPLLEKDMLERIVAELATAQRPVVEGERIRVYCDGLRPRIDYQGPTGRGGAQFAIADNDEAKGKHRLQKFRTSNTWQSAPNAWCLMTDLKAGRLWASQNGWLLVPWDVKAERWAWRRAGNPLTASTLI